MLHEFVDANRDVIVSRSRGQLTETLRLECTSTPFPPGVIGATAARRGGELLKAGFSVNQVVHDYGDICQIVTELAHEQHAPITVEEFHTLNRCLDTAIAESVTEHARITAETRSAGEVERLGLAAHELRDLLNTALLSFDALKRGAVAINGSTAELHGRTLLGLRDLVDRSLAEVRLASGQQRRERLSVGALVDEIGVAALFHAHYRHIKFVVGPVAASLTISADPQLLTSAIMNLLINGFKYTPLGGQVTLMAYEQGGRLLIEIEDECGGIPDSKGDLFQVFGERRGKDRSGLGLGLWIARKAVRDHGGDIVIRNMPGKGCVFVIDLPLQ